MNYIQLFATILCIIASVWGSQVHLLDFEPVEGASKYIIEIKFDQKYRALTIIENKTDICTYKECVVNIPSLENGASYFFTISVEKGNGQKSLVDKGQFIAELKSGKSKCERVHEANIWYKHHSADHVLISAFVTKCTENGLYAPEQSWGSIGYRWCVDVGTGIEIPNTRLRGKSDCNKYAFKTKCQQQRNEDLKKVNSRPMQFTPVACTKDGKYHIQGSSGSVRWCVDPRTGEKIRNTEIAVYTVIAVFDCNKIAQEVKALEGKKKCDIERYYGSLLAQRNPSINKNRIKCTYDGLFERKQCESDLCWCVDPEDGEEIPNTKKRGEVFC